MSRSRFSRFCAMALVAVAGTAMVGASFDAEARRMGGGSSFGRQSTNITQQRQAVTPPAWAWPRCCRTWACPARLPSSWPACC